MTPIQRAAQAAAALLALITPASLLRPPAASAAANAANALPPVLINEVLAHTDPPQTDSVELHNPTGAPVSVGNWCFSDKPSEPCRYRLPAAATIGPGGYLVLTRDDFDFGFSELGETIVLTPDAAGPYAGTEHKVQFGASDNGVSLGRVVTSDGREHFPQLQSVTLGAPNSAPLVGPVVLGALMYNPPAGGVEYIELVNTGAAPVSLCDPIVVTRCWALDGVGGFAFPPGFTLPAQSVTYVSATGPDSFRTLYSIPAAVQVTGPFTGTLSNGGETVALSRPGPPDATGEVPYIVVDEVSYEDTAPWPPEADGGGAALRRRTLGGFGQEPAHWQAGPALGDPPGAAVTGFAPRDLPGGTRELSWATDAEFGLLGFTLLYSADGERANAARVGPDLLAAQGNAHFGARYSIVDGAPGAGGAYWLEAVGWSQARRDVASVPALLPERVYLPLVQ